MSLRTAIMVRCEAASHRSVVRPSEERGRAHAQLQGCRNPPASRRTAQPSQARKVCDRETEHKAKQARSTREEREAKAAFLGIPSGSGQVTGHRPLLPDELRAAEALEPESSSRKVALSSVPVFSMVIVSAIIRG